MKASARLGCLCLWTLLAGCQDAATTPGVSRRLAGMDAAVRKGFEGAPTQTVIVSIRDPLAAQRMPDRGDGALRIPALDAIKRSILGRLAGRGDRPALVRYRYRNFALMALEVDEPAAQALREMPEVTHVFASRQGRPQLSTSVPFIRADALHAQGRTGSGTAVAVLDLSTDYWSGSFGSCPARDAWADDTPGCAIAAWRNLNAWPDPPDDQPESEPHTIAENHGHGTTVAAIARGVAPDATLVTLNIGSWDPVEGAYFARNEVTIAAFDWLADHAGDYPFVVANISFGWEHDDSRPCNASEFYDPVRTLWVDHGIVVTSSSGNDAPANWLKEPGCISLVASSGAQFDTHLSDYWSDACAHIDPLAGEILCSTNLNGSLDFLAPGAFIDAAGFQKSGTSMAAPHVAGAVALLQGQWLADEGAFRDVPWPLRELHYRALPLPHNGRSFHQLDLVGGPSWATAMHFPTYLKEDAAAILPLAPAAHEESLPIQGEGWSLGGAYLYLEVVHPHPGDVEVTLAGPSGAGVTFRLPGGIANFNGVVGKGDHPGAFLPLRGEAVDGTWTLRIADTVEGGRGHYLGATLFLLEAGACAPGCLADGCGDDGCGGICGTCDEEDTVCTRERICVACTPACDLVDCGDDGCGGSCGTCDDGLHCNGYESCINGFCYPGTQPCQEDDALACTKTCDEVTRLCNQVLEPGTCLIDGGCYDAGDPNPANACQECNPAWAQDAWSDDDTNPCDDGDVCSANVCSLGSCIVTGPTDCNDDNDCTDDTCDTIAGCQHAPVADGSPCDNGDACTENDRCSGGVCLAGSRVDCDDANPCTDESCDPDSGCVHDPNDLPCDDGSACTFEDTCAQGACTGTSMDCDDGNFCTDDGCDPGSGECTHVDNQLECDDEDPCTVYDRCFEGVCQGNPKDCYALTRPCGYGICDAVTGECGIDPLPDGTACNDEDECTENDQCQAGECLGDSVPCGCGCGRTAPDSATGVFLLLVLAAGMGTGRISGRGTPGARGF